MKFEYIFSRLSRLVFLIAFCNFSIFVAGIVYVDSLSSALGFDISLFDLEFYNFFIYTILADKLNIILYFIFFLFILIPIFLYPKSLIFAYGFLTMILCLIWGCVEHKRYIIIRFFALFMVPLLFIALIIYSILLKVMEREFIKTLTYRINNKLTNSSQFLTSISRMNKNGDDFFNFYLVFCILLSIGIVWFGWIVYIGNQGEKQAKIYLESPNYKSVILVSKQRVDGVLVSKVKNGYLFVLHEDGKNNNKATFISDSAILRID